MPAVQFNRDSWANWYATEHMKTDPDIDSIWHLPAGAGDREIRLVEINHLPGDRTDDSLEPIEFGVDMRTDNYHTLFVLDITAEQWTRIKSGELELPANWSLDEMTLIPAADE
jgi:hypothetical protein